MTDFPWEVSFMIFTLLAAVTYMIAVILKLDDEAQSR